jgi:DNA (cytosine-5)-methyltransferase 1
MILTHISLFSGIGCESIAAEWAGFKTVLLCEIDKDCQKVLRKHWPKVPIIEDVRNVTRESVIANTESVGWGTQRPEPKGQFRKSELNDGCESTFPHDDGSGCNGRAPEQGQEEAERGRVRENVEHLTLLTAGVPCQPASSAGKRRGKADDRWLWPQAIRVLSELKPDWAVFENPCGIASLFEYGGELEVDGKQYTEAEMAAFGFEMDRVCERTGRNVLDEIMDSIEAAGYEVQPVGVSACGIGAPHNRMRYFIICHTRSGGLSGEPRRRTGAQFEDGCMGNESGVVAHSTGERGERRYSDRTRSETRLFGCDNSQLNSDPQKQGLERSESKGNSAGRLSTELGSYPGWSENWIEVAQRLCSKTFSRIRDVDAGPASGILGLSRTVKLKMLGNCNPPQQYYPIYKAIADIENKLLTKLALL